MSKWAITINNEYLKDNSTSPMMPMLFIDEQTAKLHIANVGIAYNRQKDSFHVEVVELSSHYLMNLYSGDITPPRYY